MLVGATPQVLAQAAMARQFNVKDEIEVKDDLDKKPRTPELADSIQTYLFNVESFVEDLQDLRRRGIYQTGRDTFEFSHLTALPCEFTPSGLRVGLVYDQKVVVGNDGLWNSVMSLRNRLTHDFPLADCLTSNELKGRNNADLSSTNVALNRYVFSIELGFKKNTAHNATLLTDDLTSSLSQWDLDDLSPVQKQIIAFTSFRSENDQVFVVTRLPRAGLDALLASDAK